MSERSMKLLCGSCGRYMIENEQNFAGHVSYFCGCATPSQHIDEYTPEKMEKWRCANE